MEALNSVYMIQFYAHFWHSFHQIPVLSKFVFITLGEIIEFSVIESSEEGETVAANI